MILMICRWARQLDEWLQARLGRPYNALLGFGLVVEIIDQAGRLPQRLESAPNMIRSVLILAVEFALLLHQVGALSNHIDRRRALRARAGDAPDQ